MYGDIGKSPLQGSGKSAPKEHIGVVVIVSIVVVVSIAVVVVVSIAVVVSVLFVIIVVSRQKKGMFK
jgi:hypothetical protein